MRRVQAGHAAFLIALCCASPARSISDEPSASQPTRFAPADGSIAAILDRLGSTGYLEREEATRAVIALGEGVMPQLEARLDAEKDPEVRYRLRYIIENITPPDQAVLIVRPAASSGLQPGELITHVHGRRVRQTADLDRLRRESDAELMLRVNGPNGPRDVGPIRLDDGSTFCNYRASRGERVVRAVRLFSGGYAEQAYDALREVGPTLPDDELPQLLRARIAYVAGDGDEAMRLLTPTPDVVSPRSQTTPWSGLSKFDLAAPGRSPFHINWTLWTLNPDLAGEFDDPDLRVQRILAPAGRLADALRVDAGFWWQRYRLVLGTEDKATLIGGNMLAVSGWMLHELDLQSECQRLIEPRSEVLRSSPGGGPRKWLRVQTDAWLPFFRGDGAAALDGFYDDAVDVLRAGPSDNPLIRNPRVAATIAFFLYQQPADPRVAEMLGVVNREDHAGLARYAHWMLYALNDSNAQIVSEHLGSIVPNVDQDDRPALVRAAALLDYVLAGPDKAAEPRQLASALGESEIPPILRQTSQLLTQLPAGAANNPALKSPLAAVPIGLDGDAWLIIARDRRILRYSSKSGAIDAIGKPSPTWFPGVLNWPWIGREESTGRVWLYDRRRIVEYTSGGQPFRVNIRVEDIADFDWHVSPVFTALVDAVREHLAASSAAGTATKIEDGEYLRDELRANREFAVDPDLPEIGLIQALPEDARIVHVAMRGGPQLLIAGDAAGNSRAWSSSWLAKQLKLDRPPTFFPQAVHGRGEAAPIVFLIGDEGLIRFDAATQTVVGVEVPGDVSRPALIPESAPYERRDSRWVYVARLPREGGQVYRVSVDSNHVESVNMINEALPATYFRIRARSALREMLDHEFVEAGIPSLAEFVSDAAATVKRWRDARNR